MGNIWRSESVCRKNYTSFSLTKRFLKKKQASHLGSRVLFLIVTPITVYMIVFMMHFAILNRSGPGDAGMSSLFQAGLVGNDFSSNPLGISLIAIILHHG